MAIKRVQTVVTGLVDTVPSFVYIETDDTLAKVITPGYLNPVADQFIFTSKQAALCYTTDFGATVLRVEVFQDTVSLTEQFPGSVVSVSGYPNQINSSGGTNPELSFSETAIFPGSVTLNRNPENPLEAATKSYVDSLAAGFTFIAPCYAATTENLVATYNNGTSGVGAYLINAGPLGPFEVDGINPPLNARILVKNQDNPAYNGIYYVAIVGTILTNYKLTRTLDYDQASDVKPGDFVVVTNGNTNANVPFLQNAEVDIMGTDPLVWTQFGAMTGVSSVSGTDGRITSTGGTNPTIDIDADYEGQESIAIVGQIVAGEWKAQVVAPEFGGTGVDNGTKTITLGGSFSTIGNYTTTLNITATTNVIMPTTGSITTYEESYYQITGFVNQIQVIPISFPGNPKRGLDIKISPTYAGQESIYTVGILSIGTWHANKIEVQYGGTGADSFTPFGVVIGGATSTAPLQSVTDIGSEGFVLQSNGPGEAPTFLPPTGIQTLAGTLNRITVTLDDTDAVIDISENYVGQPSITTLGVIETGEWDATTIRVAKGGTGNVLFDPNGLILGGPEAFDPLTSIANGPLGSLLMSIGTDELPIWSSEPIDATLITRTDETITYPNSVGLSTFPTGFLRSETGTGDISTLIITGTADRISVANGSGPGNPSIDIASNYAGQTSIDTLGIVETGVWQATGIDLANYVVGDLDVSHLNGGTSASSTTFWNGAGVWDNAVTSVRLLGSNGIVITGTNPITTSGTITITAPSYPPDFPGLPTIVVVGIIVTGSWNANTIEVAYGGTGATSFTPFSVITAGTTATAPFQNVVGVGTLGQVLKSSGADALPIWGDIEILGTTSQIDVSPGTIPTLSLSTNVVMPGTLTLSADPVSDMEAATKRYVDAISGGIDLKSACFTATTVNLDAVYDNGAAGVGATLTMNSVGAFAVDGESPALNSRNLIKNQTNAFENGIYNLTVIGDGSTQAVLTRSSDYDTPADIPVSNLVPVTDGTVNADTSWLETATVTTIGTSPISFVQFSYSSAVMSVSGTTDRITSTGGTTPAIDIAATYVGQTSLTTLGTVTVGTWNANNIALNKITALTASRAVTSDASGFLSVSATTDTELGYLNGVTSAVQAQLNNKIGQNGSQIYGVDAGSTDSYAITLTPSLLSYSEGMAVYVKFNTANIGSASLNINSLGAKMIKKNNDQDLVDGDITESQISLLVYDGTNWQIQSTHLGSIATQNSEDVNIGGGALSNVYISSSDLESITINSSDLYGCTLDDSTLSNGFVNYCEITGGTIAGITEFDCDGWTINDNLIQGIYTDSEMQIVLSSTDGFRNVVALQTTNSGTEGALHLTDVAGTNNLFVTTNDLIVNGISRLVPILTANRAVVSNGSGLLASSATTATEIGYVNGVTSSIQTQLNSISSGSNNYATSTGSSNAYVVTLSPAPSSYAAGMIVNFKANFSNTGTSTINVNGLGSKTILKFFNMNLASNDIVTGKVVTIIYDGTNFQMQSPNNVTGTGSIVLSASPTISDLVVNNINKVAITSPATAATLTIANNSTLITSGAFSTTLTSTATTNVTLPTSGTLLSTAATITVAQGGTGQTSYTNGQLLIGNTTGNTLTKATLTGTANQIAVTNGAGSITLALSPTPAILTLEVKNGISADTNMSIKSGNYTVYTYTSTLYLESGVGDHGFPYAGYIRCVNTGIDGSGNSQANLTFGNRTYGPIVDTEIMRLNNSGNVLIGTTTDNGSKLVVNGNISATTFNGVNITASNTIGKNLLLNGDFQVSQSGTTFSVPASSAPYTSDMWQIKTNANQAYTVTNLTGINGIKVQRNSGQTGTGQILFGQSLTINQSYAAAGNVLTLSFVAARGANYSGSGVIDAIVVTGTGSSDSSCIYGTWTGVDTEGQTTPISTTLTRYTFTTPALPSNITQIGVLFGMTPTGTAGADDSVTLKDIKLEIGSAYTGYEHPSSYVTLQSVLPFHYRMSQASDCYYASVFGFKESGTTVHKCRGGLLFPVQMRVSPTVTFDTASNFAIDMSAAGDGTLQSIVSAISGINVNVNSLKFDITVNPSTAPSRGDAALLKTANGLTSFIDFAAYLT